jgi:hypothetical protein
MKILLLQSCRAQSSCEITQTLAQTVVIAVPRCYGREIDYRPLKLRRFQLPQEENWHHHKINNSTRISC